MLRHPVLHKAFRFYLSSHLFTPSNDKRFFHDKKGIISQGHSAAEFLCNKLHDEGFMLDRCVKKLEKKAWCKEIQGWLMAKEICKKDQISSKIFTGHVITHTLLLVNWWKSQTEFYQIYFLFVLMDLYTQFEL